MRKRAAQIVQVTARRYMPPWKPVPGYGGPFVGERRLSDEEIATIARWVAQGAVEGNPSDLPPAPERARGWHLGTPDLIITMPEPYMLRADGPDLFRNFVVSIPISEPRYVAGLEFRPGNTRAVHHVNLRIDRTSSSRELDAEDPLPGYEGPISPNAEFPDGHFLGWTPGQRPPRAAKGMAWRIDPGSEFVIQLHMQTSGKPEQVQSSVGLYFTDDPPVRTPMMVRIGRQNIDMAPGTARYVLSDSYRLPVHVEVYGVQPHAHFRAKEIKGRAKLPDGDMRWLIYIDDWDFGWQDVYRYVDPIALPAGTIIEMEYTYNNSANNVRNPDRPPRRVLWGQNSTDEMGDLWLQVLTRTAADRAVLFNDFRPKVLREDVIGYETMLLANPANAGLHADAALIYWYLRERERSIGHYEQAVRIDPDNPKTRYNFGTLLIEVGRVREATAELRKAAELRPRHGGTRTNLGAALRSLGQFDESIEQFRQAVAIDPDSAPAHSNLGYSLVSAGNAQEGIQHLREAIALDMNFGEPHYYLAKALASQGDLENAIAHHQQALRAAPDWVDPMSSLAWILATAADPDLLRPAEAVRLAERAAALTERRHVGVLDTLAAAYAAAGRFSDAVVTEEEAVRLAVAAGREPVAEPLRRRAERYRNRQPYRDR